MRAPTVQAELRIIKIGVEERKEAAEKGSIYT